MEKLYPPEKLKSIGRSLTHTRKSVVFIQQNRTPILETDGCVATLRKMKIFIDKYPKFIGIKIQNTDGFDKPVLKIRPAVELIQPNLKLSYIELLSSPQIITYRLDEKD